MINMQTVIQFNENHKWCGCFGFIKEIKEERVMVGVPVPQQGTAYIYCTKEDYDVIGQTDLVLVETEETDNE